MWLFGKQGRWGSTAQKRRSRSYRRRSHRSLRGGLFERLEDRRLLAIDVTFAGGVLTFTSDGTVVNNDLTINADNDASTSVSFSSPEGINLIGVATNPQAGVTSINVMLLGGDDSLTVNGFTGANAISINGLALMFAAVPYSFADVENLSVNGQGGADAISATGTTVTGALSINGGAGADTLSINSLLADILDTGSLTVADPDITDDVELRGTVTTDALAGQDYQTVVTLGTNTDLVAGAGDINFDQQITGPLFDLRPDSSGSTIFNGAVSVGGLTTLGGGQTKFNVADPLVAVLTAGNQIYNNPVLLLQDTILASTTGSIHFNNVVDAADNGAAGSDFGLTVNTPVQNNFFNAEIGGDNQDAFVMESDEHGLEYLITDATGVGGQTQFNVTDPLVAVLTTGNQEYNDSVLLRQDTILTSSGGNITFDNFVDAFDNLIAATSDFGLTVNTPAGNNVFNFEVGGDNQDLLLADSDADGLEFLTTDLTGAGGQTELNVAAPLLIAVTTTNQQRYRDNVLLTADTTLVASDAAADGNDNVIFEGTITAAADNAQSLVVNANDVTRFEGNVGSLGVQLESLTTDLAPFPASGTTEFGRLTSPTDVTVFTTGDQLFNDNVLLRTDTDLIATSGNITFEGFVDAADDGNATTSSFGLSVNTPNTLAVPTKGNNLFNDEVGGNNVAGADPNGLEDLRTDTTGVAGQTKFNFFIPTPNTVLTTLSQEYNDAVLLMQNTVLTSSAGNITFNNFVDAFDNALAGTSAASLTVNTPAGNNVFNREVGGDNQDLLSMVSDVDGLEFLSTDATGSGGQTQLNVAAPLIAVQTTGEQRYRDEVLLNVDTILRAVDNNDADVDDDIADANDNVIFERAIVVAADNLQSLVVNAADITRFGGDVGSAALRLETLTLDAPPITSNGTTEFGNPVGGIPVSVFTAGAQLYREPVILNADTTLQANNNAASSVTFERTIRSLTSGANGLVVNATGDTTFQDNVGDNNQRLEFLRTDVSPFGVAGATRINIPLAAGEVSIHTTGEQVYNDPVTLNAPANVTILTSDIGNVTFNNTLNSFQNNEEDLTVNAGNDVAFNSTVGGAAGGRLDDLTVTAANNISLALVNVTNIVDLTATGGAIIDLNAAAVNVDATALDATANDGITLDTDVATIAASNTGPGATGNITLVEEDAVTLVSIVNDAIAGNVNVSNKTLDILASFVRANGTGGNVTVTANRDLAAVDIGANNDAALTATTGNLTIGIVTAGNDATLSAVAGSITDNPTEAAVDVLAADLIATANDGIKLETDVGTITASNTGAGASGDIALIEENAVTLLNVSNTAGNINVRNKTALMTATLVNASGAGADVFLTADNGGIAMGSVSASDMITLSALNGGIADANAAGINASAADLIATARDGISLDTELARLVEVRNTTSGDIFIREENTLSVQEVVNDAQDVIITSKGHTVTVENIAAVENFAKRNFIIAVSDLPNAMPTDDVLVLGKIRAEQVVSLIGGDDVTLEATSDVRSDNVFVYIKVDAPGANELGGTAILLGALQGNNTLQYPVVIEGGAGNDTFSIQKLPQSPIAVLGRAGTLDNTFIVLTDAAEDVRVFATIVDLAGQSPGGVNPIEITYVDNEQLDLVTQGGDDKVFVQMPEPTHGILANIVRMTTGAGDDSLKINGSTLDDSIRVASYTNDPNFRFQVRGDTGETECLQVFGFTGNDTIENAAPIAALLDGGNGRDTILGGNFSIQPAAGTEVYDVIFGGGDVDMLFGRAGNDFLYADHDYNLGTPVLTLADGDIVNGGLGMDVIIALGGDSIQRDPNDFESDIVVGQGLGLSINDFLFAQLLSPNAANIDQQLQAGLAKKCAMPMP